jgi:PAS domain S-box-containing protein
MPAVGQLPVGPLFGGRGPATRYLIAIALVVAVAAARFALVPLVGAQTPLMPFIAAIYFSAYLAGFGPALVATALSSIVATFLFAQTSNRAEVVGWAAHVALFVAVGVLISLVTRAFQKASQSQHEALLAAREAEHQASSSQALLQGIADSLPALIGYVDSGLRYRFNNKRYEDWFGRSSAELFGQYVPDVIGAQAYEQIRTYMAEALSGKTVRYESLVNYRLGPPRYVDSRLIPDVAPDGTVRGMIALIEDVSERKAGAQAVQEALNSLTVALRAGRAGTFEWNMRTNESVWSAELQELFGFRPGEFGGSHADWAACIVPEDRERMLTITRESIERGAVAVDYRIRRHDTGEIRWVHGRGQFFLGEDGQPARMTGITVDITELKRTEQALRESEERLRLVTDHLPALVSYVDRNERFEFVNAAFIDWFGSDSGPIIGRHVREVLGEKTYHLREPHVRAVLRGEFVRIQGRLPRPALGERDCEIIYVPDFAPEGDVRGFYVMVQDVTERLAAVRALAERERLLQLIYDSSSDSLFLLAVEPGEQYRFMTVNETFLQVTGYTRDQVFGHPMEDMVPAANQALSRQKYREVVTTRLPVLYHQAAELRTGLRHGEVRLNPIIGPTGEVTHILGAVTDITSRRVAEEALKTADRRKDEFLAMLAHELRNPIAPIRNVANLLSTGRVKPPEIQRVGEMLVRQTSQLAHLVDDLLDAARITRGVIQLKRETVSLRACLDAAVETVQPMAVLKRQVILHEPGPRSAMVLGDLARLRQVFENLLTNAVKFSPDRGVIRVTETAIPGYAEVRVTDEGIGIDARVLPHVFDLFLQADRSLDRSQGGLGIGLTIVKHLVELHGGSIEARSEGLGRGSEFVVRLPVTSSAVLEESSRGRGTAAAAQRRVLVVEDNVDSAETLTLLLSVEGHEVKAVHDGPAALQILDSFEAEIVLLDIGLPGMDGYVVAQEMRRRFADRKLRLYALTGYGRDDDRVRALAAGFDKHLTKPVDPTTLLALMV